MAGLAGAILKVGADEAKDIRLPWRVQIQIGGELQQMRTVAVEQAYRPQCRWPAAEHLGFAAARG